MSHLPVAPRSWHVARWPLLAWLETIIKLAALAVGIAAGANALSAGNIAFPAGLRLKRLKKTAEARLKQWFSVITLISRRFCRCTQIFGKIDCCAICALFSFELVSVKLIWAR